MEKLVPSVDFAVVTKLLEEMDEGLQCSSTYEGMFQWVELQIFDHMQNVHKLVVC